MRKTRIADVILGLIILLSSGMYIRTTITNGREYGWNHNRTIMVGDYVYIEEISSNVEIVGGLSSAVIGLLLLYNAQSLPRRAHIHDDSESGGIQFPLGELDGWDIQYDRHTGRIGVILEDKAVTFPLEMVQDWEEDRT